MTTTLLYALIPLAGFAVLRWAVFPLISRRIDGPNAPIVVVDRRTYRLAETRIDAAIAAGDWRRARAGLIALSLWLRGEIATGPKRHRVRYARALEAAELRVEQGTQHHTV